MPHRATAITADPPPGIRCVLWKSAIGAGEERHLILEGVGGASVLTMGESERFVRLGGMIAFTLDQQRVRFTINPEAAESSRLRNSSKVLSLARIVHE
jgi:YfiR/HmsC-like